MTKLEIQVSAEPDENTGRTNVKIKFPPEQGSMSTRMAAHLLISGASLLVKACAKTDTGIKDYELVHELITHLTNEFTSTESFEDAKLSIKQK